MKRRVAFIVLVSFFLAFPARADMKLFPMWKRMHCGSEQFACYDFETAKKILKLDLDLQLKLDKLDICLKDKSDLETARERLEAANEVLSKINLSLETRLKEKQEVLEKNTLELAKAENRSIWNNLHWVAIIVVVVASGAFIGGYYLGSN